MLLNKFRRAELDSASTFWVALSCPFAVKPSSWSVVVQDLVVYNKRNTTDAGQKPSSMPLSYNGTRTGGPSAARVLIYLAVRGDVLRNPLVGADNTSLANGNVTQQGALGVNNDVIL